MLNYNVAIILLHAVITFFVTVVIGLIGMPILKKFNAAQHVRNEGPATHVTKTGTPTMGGWFFILGILIVAVLSNLFLTGTPTSLWFYVMALVSYAAIGFADDFIKIKYKRNLGLTSKQKLLLQIVMVIILFVLFNSHFQHTEINLIFGSLPVPYIVYIIFAVFWFVGFSNATNITDGLDGLLATTACIAFVAFGIIDILLGKTGTATICFITFGALLGFLVFNNYPAKVFMGDTGSLAIGALLAAISIELHMEFYLLIIGIVFVVETASVLLQVTYFKYTKKKYGEGKRILLMAPLHHHLELKGYSETQTVFLLVKLGVFGAILGIILFIIRMPQIM